MDLILWRHAEAEDYAPDHTDQGRRLTLKGHQQAQKIAAKLGQALPSNTQIIVSPAVRTQETVAALNMQFEVSNQLSTNSGVEEHLALIRESDHQGSLLLVGHQPTLGQLAALLVSGQFQNWSVKKGAIWWLKSKDRLEPCHWSVKQVLNPDQA